MSDALLEVAKGYKGKSRLDRLRYELAQKPASQERAEELEAEIASIEWGMRWIEFLGAVLGKAVTESVVYNVVEWQWKEGVLRADRQYQHYNRDAEKGMSADAFKANEASIISNKSESKILAQMGKYKEKHSMDMCDVAEAWFGYVTEGGAIPGTVAQGKQDDLPF